MKTNLKIYISVLWILLSLVLASTIAAAFDCVEATSDPLTQSVVFCENDYYLPNGITLDKDAKDITIDCNFANISGNGNGQGVLIESTSGITLTNCILSNYHEGIMVLDSSKVTLNQNFIFENYNGVKVMSSNNSAVNNNEIRDNENIGLYLISCLNCEHKNNVIEGNVEEGMVIEYACAGGDDICPENCNGTIDYDCEMICGDGVCTTEGDCDCQPGEVPLDQQVIPAAEAPVVDNTEKNATEAAADETSASETSDGTTDILSTDAATDSADKTVDDAGADNAAYTSPDFNFDIETPETTDSGAAQDVTVYPITDNLNVDVPAEVFDKVGVDSLVHVEISKLFTFEKKKIVYQDSTVFTLYITPNKDIPLLEIYEYFPDAVLKDAATVSTDQNVDNQKVTFSKKKQMAKIKLTKLEKGQETQVSFTLDTQVNEGQSYSVFYKVYSSRSWLIACLFVLILLMYAYYIFSATPFLKKYDMYFHKHISDKYLVISKDRYMNYFHVIPVVVLVLFVFEVSFKLIIGLFLLKALFVLLALAYIVLTLGLLSDLMDFKGRYNIKG